MKASRRTSPRSTKPIPVPSDYPFVSAERASRDDADYAEIALLKAMIGVIDQRVVLHHAGFAHGHPICSALDRAMKTLIDTMGFDRPRKANDATQVE